MCIPCYTQVTNIPNKAVNKANLLTIFIVNMFRTLKFASHVSIGFRRSAFIQSTGFSAVSSYRAFSRTAFLSYPKPATTAQKLEAAEKEKAKKTKAKEKAKAEKALKKEKAKEKERAKKAKLSAKLKEKKAKAEEKLKAKKAKNIAKEKEIAAIKQAFSKPKKVSAFNMYTAEGRKEGLNLIDIGIKWKSLSESGKQTYQEKADVKNESKKELFDLFDSKPKRPASNYAKFLQEKYHEFEGTLPERSTLIKAAFDKLTPDEQKSYGATQEVKDAYKKTITEWKKKVLLYYNL